MEDERGRVLDRKFWTSTGEMKAHLKFAIDNIKAMSVTLQVTRMPPQYDLAVSLYGRFVEKLNYSTSNIYHLSVDLNRTA